MRKNREGMDKLIDTPEQIAKYKIHAIYICIISAILLFIYVSDFVNEHNHHAKCRKKETELRDSVIYLEHKYDSLYLSKPINTNVIKHDKIHFNMDIQ